MRRLLPKTLFGQLVAILTVGLILAQSLSAALNLWDRERLVRNVSAMRWAQRVSDNVRILDTLQAEQRARVANILSNPRWEIIVPAAAPTETSPHQVNDAWTGIFVESLQAQLGADRPLQIRPVDEPRRPARWRLLHAFEPFSRHPPLSVLTRLTDGTWVRFESGIPREPPWPSRLLIQSAVLLGAVLLLAMVAVTWVTRPISLLAKAARDLGRDIYRPPLRENGPVEVQRAAQAFNAMQARVIQYIDGRTRLFTAISHDLKTPITRLRLRAEMLDDPELQEKIGRDLSEMESMVSESLDFLRGLHSQEPLRPVDINALLSSLVEDAVDLGQDVGVTGRVSTPYPAKAQALKRCLNNLIDNAVRYGSQARIHVEDSPQALRIHVMDNGPGIQEDELERVFEPFYRLDPSRSRQSGGTGLGLAIARDIIQTHGGQLTLHNRSGGGLDAVIVLPRGDGH